MTEDTPSLAISWNVWNKTAAKLFDLPASRQLKYNSTPVEMFEVASIPKQMHLVRFVVLLQVTAHC